MVSRGISVARVGVDVGGTFTDIVLSRDGQLAVAKVPSTPHDPSKAVLTALARVLAMTGTRPEEVESFGHGCTVAVNAVLQRKGVRTGVFMTRGFEDTLAIGRENRSDLYDVFLGAETPEFIAPRRIRVGVEERLDAQGKVITPLNEEQVRAEVQRLKAQYDIQALAVCYLFSYLNPAHELGTRDIVRECFPDIRVSLSCEIDPVFKEYERLCLTAFDAYIGPLMDSYLGRLEDALAKAGVPARLQVIQSRGGMASSRLARERPVNTVNSGPAAAVIAGAHLGRSCKLPSGGPPIQNLITIDIGGTSCDVALITQGRPMLTTEGRLGAYPVRRSMIDVGSIGAGGGSIAWLDAAGGLRVGPQSAGAYPGPACYGHGGSLPTVTDASLVLGLLDPGRFAGGDLTLHRDAAEAALRGVAGPLGMDVMGLSWGIHEVVNSRIADQIRLVSLKRGYDPRGFVLLAGGGAGPIHAGLLAQRLSIPWVLVPAAPGALAAYGLLVADVEHEKSRTLVMRWSESSEDVSALETAFRELTRQCYREMEKDGVREETVRVRRSADMRYAGQSNEIEVPVEGEVGLPVLGRAIEEFQHLHERLYGHRKTGVLVEFVNLRVVAAYTPPAISFRGTLARGALEEALTGVREVYLGRRMEARVYDRPRLPVCPPGCAHLIEGPAIVEQPDTTTVVYPGQRCFVDEAGNLLIQAIA